MDRLINFLNDIDMDAKTERIIAGELEANLIEETVREFNALHVEKRYVYMNRLTQRISKIKKPQHLLNVLLLLDTIYQYNPRMPMPQTFVESLQSNMKKETVILRNIISYYLYFLKCNISNRFNVETINPQDEFQEVMNFCQISTWKIAEFFKISFVFEHGILQLKQHKLLIKSVIKSILIRFRQDLKIVNMFIKNNLEIILQRTVRHPMVFSIYSIYQRLILINKDMSKLKNFNRLIQTSIDFPIYEVDVEMNRELEFTMMERKEEACKMAESAICRSQEQIIHEDYISEQRSIHTTESFLLNNDEGFSLF